MLNLKDIRKENGLQQKDLAKLLNKTTACISSWETGKTEPSLDDILQLANILNVSTDYFLGRVDEFDTPLNYKTTYVDDILLENFKQLDNDKRNQVIGFIRALLQK